MCLIEVNENSKQDRSEIEHNKHEHYGKAESNDRS